MTTTCKAKDKNNCRYHTPVMHARMDRDEARVVYERALEDYSKNGSRKQELTVGTAKLAYGRAEVYYASFDEGYEEIETRAKAASGQDRVYLENLLGASKKAREERLEAEKVKTAQQLRFDEIKAEVEAEDQEAISNPLKTWKYGYQKALCGLFGEQAEVLHENAFTKDKYGYVSDNYYYGGRVNREDTEHLRECDSLQIKEVEDTDYHEFAGTFADEDEGRNFVVRARLTCKCGHLVERYAEVDGSLTDLTRDLLKF